jgi:hypothetical protein
LHAAIGAHPPTQHAHDCPQPARAGDDAQHPAQQQREQDNLQVVAVGVGVQQVGVHHAQQGCERLAARNQPRAEPHPADERERDLPQP